MIFTAQLKTKDKQISINCSTFSEAWTTLNNLRDNSTSTVLEALVLKENIPVASMRIVK